MLCDECRERPATFHLTKVVNGETTEMHLCEQCAREKGEFEFTIEPGFSIHQLLAGLLNFEGAPAQAAAVAPTCDVCGLSYEDFARTGRLGCGHCYEQFEDRLEPLVRRIHGASLHTGKVPRRTGGRVRVQKEISQLKAQLQAAVAREDFELAARLRDQIRDMEKKIQ